MVLISERFLRLYLLLLKTAEGVQRVFLFVTFKRQLSIVLSFTKKKEIERKELKGVSQLNYKTLSPTTVHLLIPTVI